MVAIVAMVTMVAMVPTVCRSQLLMGAGTRRDECPWVVRLEEL
jgi:hypothetical protein